MFPDYNSGRLAQGAKVSNEGLQRFSHVPVAQVPGRHCPMKHRAVILLRVFHQARVLFSEKEIVRSHASVASGIVGCASAQLEQLADNLLLARRR